MSWEGVSQLWAKGRPEQLQQIRMNCGLGSLIVCNILFRVDLFGLRDPGSKCRVGHLKATCPRISWIFGL